MSRTPVTVSSRKRKNERPPRQNVYVIFKLSRLIRTGCRCRKTLLNMISAWFRGVLGYPVRKMLLKTRFSVSARRKFPWRRSSRKGFISCMSERHLDYQEDRRAKPVGGRQDSPLGAQVEAGQRM